MLHANLLSGRHLQLTKHCRVANNPPVQHRLIPQHSYLNRCQSRLVTRAGAENVETATPSAFYTDTVSKLDVLNTLQRQLAAAVAEEDYEAAQQLKRQADELKQQLPPVQRYMLAQTEKLRNGSPADRRAAITALAEVGDELCWPNLAACLHDEELNKPATDAMWATFHRHPDPAVQALMDQGMALLQPSSGLLKYRAALDVYTAACKLAPSYAEAHNKRATVLYLMHKYQDSIEACKLVLDLNPYHFGAASGMGMCHIHLEQHEAALAAFERALAINPFMDPIQKYAAALRAKLADDSGR